MARFQCRACGFDGRAEWEGKLRCPSCGDTDRVRAAMATGELTEAEMEAIAAAAPGGGMIPKDA